ncbi:hypothetical protein A2714_05685 [Candidatus Woesebacteria bacterium RIFCSPHIGHO2_01_FULL_38_9]|uniref:Glycosyltransferase 2-like domain-containing protein n=2 Tax=Candidatus Woeseibacteriota TaxID=1752722 RepID=A0A1F7Y1D7_9BACT|nr:MAG: hypothetical protein A2714_05685 [Candidatus Woesebacteria bacterium RIFCSPHIGHO2_01_FULL_38_9]OGM58367.1 MAG: hypothetical protein A3A75_05065 [Candidatus Woesebacteria bacterium RIFCSPLOWO2_01_FULL_39_10]
MLEKKLVSVIIANYNGEDYLETCLTSVIDSIYKNYEVIIVDDGSEDKSVKIIKLFILRDSRIKLLENKKNKGAAASRNIAINKALGEIIVFLDNDTEVSKNWLNELLFSLEDKKVGAAQALLLDFDQRGKIQMAGGYLIPHTGWLSAFFVEEDFLKCKNKLFEKNIIAISAALAVRREVLELVGNFDDKEAVTTEDLDLSWRIWIAGYRVVLSPKSIVFHHTQTLENRRYLQSLEKVYFHLAKNSFRSIIKNYRVSNVLKFLPYSILVNLARGFMVLIRRKSPSALNGTIKAFWWNVLNFKDTLEERKFVQRMRRFDDDFLLKRIFDKRTLIEIYGHYI